MYQKKWALAFLALCAAVLLGGQPVQAEIGNSLVQENSDTNEKHYAAADVSTNLNIRQAPGVEEELVGKIPAGGIMEICGYEDGWCLVTSGPVTGYVCADYLYSPEETARLVEQQGLEHMATAYPVSEVREELIAFASQFIGNPYVWGGTSLTSGADCSGFVQSVYAAFGVELPRTSREQARAGRKLSVEEAEPGDLIFYARGGSVYHVVICLGDGRVLGASDESRGICISNLNRDRAVWAADVLGEAAIPAE